MLPIGHKLGFTPDGMLCSLFARRVSSAVNSSSGVKDRQFGAIMSSTSKLYPPADISKRLCS